VRATEVTTAGTGLEASVWISFITWAGVALGLDFLALRRPLILIAVPQSLGAAAAGLGALVKTMRSIVGYVSFLFVKLRMIAGFRNT
jgi:hypothetical protein